MYTQDNTCNFITSTVKQHLDTNGTTQMHCSQCSRCLGVNVPRRELYDRHVICGSIINYSAGFFIYKNYFNSLDKKFEENMEL